MDKVECCTRYSSECAESDAKIRIPKFRPEGLEIGIIPHDPNYPLFYLIDTHLKFN